jgi:hypothetical protein
MPTFLIPATFEKQNSGSLTPYFVAREPESAREE